MRFLNTRSWCVVLVFIAGCSSQNEKYARESLRLVNARADLWELAATKSNEAEIQECCGQALAALKNEMREHKVKLQKLPESDQTAIEKICEQLQQEFQRAEDRFRQAQKKVEEKLPKHEGK